MNLNSLSERLRACRYPPQLEHVECGILGSGFYPGARGFSCSGSPYDGIMLLGRDFGTKAYYQRLCGIPRRDETASTWRRTRDIYLASFIGLPVWCTNYIVGVRKNGSSVGNVKERIHLIGRHSKVIAGNFYRLRCSSSILGFSLFSVVIIVLT
jgi:hypothetical protein